MSPHTAPMALRQVTEGLADISRLVSEASTVDECLRLRHELQPLTEAAIAIEARSLQRADDLLKEK